MNELEKIKPNIPKKLKNNPFCVPDAYFEELPLNIQYKLEQKKSKILIPFIYLKPIYKFTLAFIIAGAVFLGSYLVFFNNIHKELNTEYIIDYLIYNNDEIDDTIYTDEMTSDENVKQNSNELIIEYLISENIENSTILENY